MMASDPRDERELWQGLHQEQRLDDTKVIQLDTYDFFRVKLRWWQYPNWWARAKANRLRWWWDER